MDKIPELFQFLKDEGYIDTEGIKTALKTIQEKKIPATTYLVQENIVSSATLLTICSVHFGLPIFDLSDYQSNWFSETLIPYEFIERYHLIPLKKENATLQLGIADPTDYSALSAISFYVGLHIQPYLVDENKLTEIIESQLTEHVLASQVKSLIPLPINKNQEANEDPQDTNDPIIGLVNQLIYDALQKKASDIHLEPYKQNYRIRFRRDGFLSEIAILPHSIADRVKIRLKILANLNIAEHRLPQDGRFLFEKLSNKVDIRINCCPVLYGEKIVLRLLNSNQEHLSLDHLGLLPPQHKLLMQALSQPQGLLLATGPTGSGKTMLLYAALNHLNTIDKNISTVEDPIEKEWYGINQIHIHPQIGWDFASALRTLLRQDPDVIMVGEIRDNETASMAIHASQTGHLVLSTLHANHALGAIHRLGAMNISLYSIMNSLSLLLAQRLVRCLCEFCRKKSGCYWEAIGCEYCHQGYRGRTGIFEVIPITELLIDEIKRQTPLKSLKESIQKQGYFFLYDAAIDKVTQGITSLKEINRVLGQRYDS